MKKISTEELLGIPKATRNQRVAYLDLGTFKIGPGTVSVQGELFGDFMDIGSELVVYYHATDPNKVLKVYHGNSAFGSIDEIRNFHKMWFLRNQIPMTEKIRFEGILRGEDDELYPVYSQTKLKELPDMSFEYFKDNVIPRMNIEMHKAGYVGEGTYFKEGMVIDLLVPDNVGIDSKGNIKIFDPEVFFLNLLEKAISL